MRGGMEAMQRLLQFPPEFVLQRMLKKSHHLLPFYHFRLLSTREGEPALQRGPPTPTLQRLGKHTPQRQPFLRSPDPLILTRMGLHSSALQEAGSVLWNVHMTWIPCGFDHLPHIHLHGNGEAQQGG